MFLTHLDEVQARNQALVNGRETLLARPASAIAQSIQAELGLSSTAALRGLFEANDDAYLEWAVEQLQRLAEVSYVLIGELSGADWDRVQTIQLRTPEGPGENFVYDLLGTPCSNVVGKSSCIYPSQVAELFPDDVLLAQMGIESYVGLPFFDPGGRPLGLAIILDERSWSTEKMQDILGLMVAFRPRLEAIMSNRRARRDLELLGEQLEHGDDRDPLARLARSFAHAMNVRGAFVACPVEGSDDSMQTVARIVGGEGLARAEYLLSRSPLANGEAEALIPNQLAATWPEGVELASFDAASCLILTLEGADGAPVGQLGLVHDRPLNRQIGEQAVVGAFRRQIAFELRRQRVEAERLATERRLLDLQRTESLGILAGGIAHDFNNLLVGVLGNADLALLDLPKGNAQTRESLVDIRDAARGAMQLCQQMLAYAGRATVESQRFELGLEIDELSRLLSASIAKTSQLIVERGDSQAWIDGDRVQIRQVLMNLITNANDAIGESGGRIRVRVEVASASEPLAVLGGTLAPGTYVCLRVHDDGCGMDDATLARIFDPFFSTKQHGHGLGLAAMLGIVRSHGGGVLVSSTVGAGTCFQVYLPQSEPGEPELRATKQANQGAAHVLVVDDSASVRKVARRMLERAGYQVTEAFDGLDALAQYEREPAAIDCVLLDLGMPRLGGIETMKRLRAITPGLPVIISSGYSGATELDSVRDEASCAVVHKPYDVEQLTSAFIKLLET